MHENTSSCLSWGLFFSPPALFSEMHVFFSLLGCLQLFYHWQAGMALRRYQIGPQCINQGNWRSWVKRPGHFSLIKANTKANTQVWGCWSVCMWFLSAKRQKDIDKRLFFLITTRLILNYQFNSKIILPVYWKYSCCICPDSASRLGCTSSDSSLIETPFFLDRCVGYGAF